MRKTKKNKKKTKKKKEAMHPVGAASLQGESLLNLAGSGE
jgi:hypothetical protein